MLPNKSENIPEQEICHGILFQRGEDVQKKTCVKTSLYDWILQYTQVVQYPIRNDCLKVYIGIHYEKI